MARSAPTAAGVHTEITLEPLLEESTLEDRILSLQPREDQTFLSHVVFLKCRKALRETTRVITSQEQEAEKLSAKEKRMVPRVKTGFFKLKSRNSINNLYVERYSYDYQGEY